MAGREGNYPPENDTTSEGGLGPHAWSNPAEHGLVDQSLNCGPIKDEIDDAIQGSDTKSRELFHHEQARDSLNPYNNSSLESRDEASQNLASKMSDSRGRQYESGPASSLDNSRQ